MLCEADLLEMLNKNLKNNQKKDLTGIMLYSDGTFIQLLEGAREAVEACYRKIQKDNRQTGFMALLSGEEKERTFADWSMAFKVADESQLIGVKGYIQPEEISLEREKLSAPLFVLKAFADNHRLIA